MSSARRNDGIRQAVAARDRGRAKVRNTTTALIPSPSAEAAVPGSTLRNTGWLRAG